MKTMKFLIATALVASLAQHTATAAEPPKPEAAEMADVVEQGIEAIATPSDDEIAVHEAEKLALMETLHQAHMGLQRGSRHDGELSINKAFDQLEALVQDGIDQEVLAETSPARLVDINYGSVFMPERVYVPIKTAKPDADDFADALDLKGIDRGEVENARVRYVHLMVDRDALTHDLNEARQELTENDIDGAKAQILDAQKGMLRTFRADLPTEGVARDHIALSRYMMKVAEYEGAREALESAEEAMISLHKEQDVTGRNAPEMDKLRNEMEQLSAMIDQRDPTLANQIDEKLESWLDQLG